METKLYFDMPTVARLMEHAAGSTERRGTAAQLYDDDFNEISDPVIPPGLIWVKDQGIYLLSNGRMPEGQTALSTGLVTYAEGFNPDRDPDCLRRQDRAVGGDDFAEFIDLEWVRKAVGTRTHGWLILSVTRVTFSLRWTGTRG